jgi:hypothetical protein
VPTLHVRLTDTEMKVLEESRIELEHSIKEHLSWREFFVRLAQEHRRAR